MPTSFEEDRGAILQTVAELYSRGRLTESAMGDLIERVTHAEPGGLEAIVGALPRDGLGDLALRTSLLSTPVQRLGGEGSVVRKKGAWLKSRRLDLVGRASVYRLDLSAYAGMSGISLELHLEVAGCSVIVKVPRSFRVKDSIEDSKGSVVKVRGREAKDASNLLVLRGSVQGSVIKALLR